MGRAAIAAPASLAAGAARPRVPGGAHPPRARPTLRTGSCARAVRVDERLRDRFLDRGSDRAVGRRSAGQPRAGRRGAGALRLAEAEPGGSTCLPIEMLLHRPRGCSAMRTIPSMRCLTGWSAPGLSRSSRSSGSTVRAPSGSRGSWEARVLELARSKASLRPPGEGATGGGALEEQADGVRAAPSPQVCRCSRRRGWEPGDDDHRGHRYRWRRCRRTCCSRRPAPDARRG